MDRRLIWTERPSSAVDAIVRYIARRNPKASGKIGLGICQRAQILLTHPEAGTVLEESRGGHWRKLICRRWKIVYRVLDDVIVVGRVWPASKGEADLSTPLE